MVDLVMNKKIDLDSEVMVETEDDYRSLTKMYVYVSAVGTDAEKTTLDLEAM